MRCVAGSVVLAALAVVTGRAEDPDLRSAGPEAGRQRSTMHNRAANKRQELSLSEEVDSAHAALCEGPRRGSEDTTGISYSMETSFMSQWGTPNGGYGAGAGDVHAGGELGHAFSSPTRLAAAPCSSISCRRSTSRARRERRLGGNINLISPINNQPDANQPVRAAHLYARASWATGSRSRLASTPSPSFDGNAYANDQQVKLHRLLADAERQPELQPGGPRRLCAAQSDQGNHLRCRLPGRQRLQRQLHPVPDRWARPVCLVRLRRLVAHDQDWGQGNYALLYYNQPGVSLQPLASSGLSFSASQPIGDKVGLFLRANTAWQSSFAIQSSIAGGAVLNDPVEHSRHDQIGLAVAWNATNMSLFSGTFVAAERDHGGGLLVVVGVQGLPGHAGRAALPAAGPGAVELTWRPCSRSA